MQGGNDDGQAGCHTPLTPSPTSNVCSCMGLGGSDVVQGAEAGETATSERIRQLEEDRDALWGEIRRIGAALAVGGAALMASSPGSTGPAARTS